MATPGAVPGRGGRRKTKPTTISKEEAQRLYVEGIGLGLGRDEAATRAQRTIKAVEYWRKTDLDFRARADQARLLAVVSKDRDPRDISFEDFCETYLGQRMFWHQLQWVDLLEGREPREVHPAQRYEKANPRFLLINTPVHHAKTATISTNYVLYRICMDPQVRVKIVSKTQVKAREILQSIKKVLSDPEYAALQAAFAPQGGWKATAEAWRADYFYVEREGKERDPTVEALGIGGQIYGSRANLIVLDDCVTGSNAHEWEKQLTWINREVRTRLGRTGKLLVVGTRIAPVDLYRELRNGENFSRGVSPWTYFAQPAVLEFQNDPADWHTLWPRSNATIEDGAEDVEPDEDGMYPAWDGPALLEARESISESDWAMVYQQADSVTSAAFPTHAVKGSCGMRDTGPMVPGVPGHRGRGMDGLYVIGSIDPSGSGDSGFVAYAVDRETKRRYVLRVQIITPWVWSRVRALIHEWTDELGINEWVVEKNMYHAALRHDEETVAFLQTRGVRMTEHFTQGNKHDVNIGVASLSPLFGEWEKTEDGRGWEARVKPLIELPKRHSEGALKLVEQLVTWFPDTKNKTDLVMALWFAELRARAVLAVSGGGRNTHLQSRFASPRRVARRGVVDMRDFAQKRGA